MNPPPTTTAVFGCPFAQVLLEAVHVRHRPQAEDVRRVGPGHGRRDGVAALRQDERVVGVLDLALRSNGPDRAPVPVDGDRLGPQVDLDTVAPVEAFGGLQQQGRALLDVPGDEVGQAAVRVGDVGAALEHRDLGGLVCAAGAGGGGRATGDAPDDEDFLGVLRFHALPVRQTPGVLQARATLR
jgi:hypothetical protein